MFLGNIHPLVGLWTSQCFIHAFGGDFGTVAKYFQKKFLALIHPPLVAVFGSSIGIGTG
jgi:hypothetical protein